MLCLASLLCRYKLLNSACHKDIFVTIFTAELLKINNTANKCSTNNNLEVTQGKSCIYIPPKSHRAQS